MYKFYFIIIFLDQQFFDLRPIQGICRWLIKPVIVIFMIVKHSRTRKTISEHGFWGISALFWMCLWRVIWSKFFLNKYKYADFSITFALFSDTSLPATKTRRFVERIIHKQKISNHIAWVIWNLCQPLQKWGANWLKNWLVSFLAIKSCDFGII